MKISSKGRYALRMLLDLAEHRDAGYISLKDIAERQNISKKYLEQIVPILNRNRILKTNRGSQGGYMLALSPERCTVGTVLRLTEEVLAPSAPTDDYTLLPVWQGLDRVVDAYLDSVTLQDLLERQRERYGNDYVI